MLRHQNGTCIELVARCFVSALLGGFIVLMAFPVALAQMADFALKGGQPETIANLRGPGEMEGEPCAPSTCVRDPFLTDPTAAAVPFSVKRVLMLPSGKAVSVQLAQRASVRTSAGK